MSIIDFSNEQHGGIKMNDGMLSQEEIDLHFGRTNIKKEFELTESDKDVIGEAGNIFTSTSATSLSTILSRRVLITTPVVTYSSLYDIHQGMVIPYVVVTIKFQNGLDGSNLLLIKTEDASVIADIMMGGDGKNKKLELNEIELSAVAEAMNQMIGSAATSIATMLNRPVEISAPETEVWADLDDIENGKYTIDDKFVKIGFTMSIEGLLETSIMQLYSVDAVKDIVNVLTNGLQEEEPMPERENEAKKQDILSNYESIKDVESVQETEVDLQPMPKNMELLLDVLLNLNVVFGRTKKSIKEILTFGTGTVIELDEFVDEPLEIYVNNKLIAYGEVVAVDEKYGVRVTRIASTESRINEIL